MKSLHEQVLDLLEKACRKPPLVDYVRKLRALERACHTPEHAAALRAVRQRSPLSQQAEVLMTLGLITRGVRRSKGKKAAVAALEDAATKVNAAYKAFSNLPLEAHMELQRQLGGVSDQVVQGRTLFEVMNKRATLDPTHAPINNLGQLGAAARKASIAVSAAEYPNPSGRPKKGEVLHFVKMAASVFKDITGEDGTRAIDAMTGQPNSPFHEFVAALFEILEIKASADEQIRKYLAMGKSATAPPANPH